MTENEITWGPDLFTLFRHMARSNFVNEIGLKDPGIDQHLYFRKKDGEVLAVKADRLERQDGSGHNWNLYCNSLPSGDACIIDYDSDSRKGCYTVIFP